MSSRRKKTRTSRKPSLTSSDSGESFYGLSQQEVLYNPTVVPESSDSYTSVGKPGPSGYARPGPSGYARPTAKDNHQQVINGERTIGDEHRVDQPNNNFLAMWDHPSVSQALTKTMTPLIAPLVDQMKAVLSDVRDMRQDMSVVKTDVSNVKNDLDAVSTRTDNIEQRMSALERNPNSISGSGSDIDVIREISDQDKRRRNMMLFNIPEFNTDAPGYEAESRLVSQLIADKMGSRIALTSVRRVSTLEAIQRNSIPGNPRPILVRFPNDVIKWSVLAKLNDCSVDINGTQIKIYAKPDLTPLQRKIEKQLVNEKKSKNEEEVRRNTGTQWGIRDWKVVKLQSTNM